MKSKQYSVGRFLAVLFFCFVASFLGSWVFLSSGIISSRNAVNTVNTIVSSEENVTSEVAKKVSPSVVSISTTVISTNGYLQTTAEGAGTGVVISKDGYILTNKHVIDDAREVSIVMHDGSVHQNVKLVGVDPLNDLAFLKISSPPRNLTVATLGNSAKTTVGQRVLAIGNALGEFQNSVTTGIISGIGRPITADNGTSEGESLENLLQTDAAINPGNSGGPLVNLNSEVVGINTAVAADSQGIGFAIPINAAKGMTKHLLKTGKVERAYLGVTYVSITPAIASSFNLPVKKGAYVYQEGRSPIITNSPAQRAGLQNGDIITNVNRAVIDEQNALSLVLAQYTPGEKVTLSIIRSGEKRDVNVTLDAYK